MKKRPNRDKKISVRLTVKEKAKKTRNSRIEREYQTVFAPHPLPYQGLYTDEDSLEQPSALKYVPTTATPTVEASTDRMRRDAELERSIR
jgi:hypothetical protein